MSDTFVGDITNPAEAFGDITGMMAVDHANAATYIALVENGTVNFEAAPIDIVVDLKNTGGKDGSFTVTLYRDNVQTETATISVTAGATSQQQFNNAAAGYANPDGETHTYKATVTP